MTMEEVIAGFKDLSNDVQQRINQYAQSVLDLPTFPLTATFVRINRFEGEQKEKGQRLLDMVKTLIETGELGEFATVEPAKGQAAGPHQIEETKKAVAKKAVAKAKAPEEKVEQVKEDSGNVPESSSNLPQPPPNLPEPKAEEPKESFDPMAVLAKGILPHILKALPKSEAQAFPEEAIRKIVRAEVVRAFRLAVINIAIEE